MISQEVRTGDGAYWFVGSSFGGTKDQTKRFLKNGIWEVHNPTEKESAAVNSMEPGDKIAIKASYVRKKGLPFDNRGYFVSAMLIKAIGVITENLRNGESISVEWEDGFEPKEWFFYTHRSTIWRLNLKDWGAKGLVAFAFHSEPQDIDRFRNDPYWRERFGDSNSGKERFKWTSFYESFADKLLKYKDNRFDLIQGIHAIAAKMDGLSYLQDQFKNGSSGPLQDICPFTAMGIFNRGIKTANRKRIAKEAADFLGVKEPVPDSFEGIPILNNQKSWFFGYEKDREPDDIDVLWDFFAQALKFADSENDEGREAFIAAYDKASNCKGVGWNLTMGLYWIRPWFFPTLESQSKEYIEKKLSIKIGRNSSKNYSTAKDYLKIRDSLDIRFNENFFPVHSFPELSYAAWLYKPETDVTPISDSYSVDNIIQEGAFLDRSQLEYIVQRIEDKVNLILQGPPGTGKTWLAKKLAFALMGKKDESKVRALQFHPNLSYEDFVRGWRPDGDGRLALVDGPFMEVIMAAGEDPGVKYVVIIEEINRGNPAQIFGEMLTLLEADKRTPSEALELCYRKDDEERVHIPANVFVIGTMNIADRSLALVDLALRRRFAFIDLKPVINERWHDWVSAKNNVESEVLLDIQNRMNRLNADIEADASLGRQFQIGHSYVTPSFDMKIVDGREWFRQVVQTEIGPLLDEYWYDAPEKAKEAVDQLLKGL